MSMLVLGSFLRGVAGFLMCITSLFLILLVMLQRGRGGGLSGAFGGAGGQSAFGTKTGDVFTKITIVTAGIWIALCIALIWGLSGGTDLEFDTVPATTGIPASEEPPPQANTPAKGASEGSP